MARTKKQNYWTDIEEQLVIDYQNATVYERSEVYNQLRQKLIKMYSSILLRYFGGNIGGWSKYQITDIITDCETSIVENTIHNFNPDNGTAYAYLGTSARNFLSDRLIRHKYEGKYHEPLKYYESLEINSEGDYNYDIPVEIDDQQMSIEDLLEAAKERVTEIRNNQNLNSKQKHILECLENYLNEIPTEYYSRHSLNYFLMKNTGLNGITMVQHLNKAGIKDLIFCRYNFNHYKQLFIENNIDENDDQQVNEFLSTLKRYKYETNYKIENRSEKRALEKKKKLKDRKIPQSVGLSV